MGKLEAQLPRPSSSGPVLGRRDALAVSASPAQPVAVCFPWPYSGLFRAPCWDADVAGA
jgi:hypothetical protein